MQRNDSDGNRRLDIVAIAPDPDDSEPNEGAPATTVSTASIRELILGSWQLSIIVVDPELRFKYANSQGKALLNGGAMFRLRSGVLACADAAENDELAERVRITASKAGLGEDGLVGWAVGPVTEPSKRLMVRFGVLLSPRRSTPLVELRIAPADGDFVPPQRLVAHSLGLTKTQASIAVEIARGHTTVKIAEQLRIKPDTVKDHLKSIYQRLHIDGARERGIDAKALLIRKIMAIGY